jgi:hypothetical protein
MSHSSNALTPPAGVSSDEFSRLLAQGRERRGLSVDDVMAVLKDVELSEDLIAGVRRRLSDEGIHLDEGEVELNGADLVPPEEPANAPRRPGLATATRRPPRRPSCPGPRRRHGRPGGCPTSTTAAGPTAGGAGRLTPSART